MATVPETALRRVAWSIALLLAPWSVGCLSVPHCSWCWHQPPPRVCNVAVMWQNSIGEAANLAAGGNPVPTLAGRMYLLAQDGAFQPAMGGFWVELWDDNQAKGDKPLFRWDFGEKDMPNLMKMDHWGLGYTVLLPWEGLRPDLCKVRMRTCYQPKNSTPVYTENVVTLEPSNGVIRQGTGPITPAGFKR